MLALLQVLAILASDLAAPPPEPTTVCPVLPTVPSTEVWPYLISELDVGEFRLVEAPASAIVCR